MMYYSVLKFYDFFVRVFTASNDRKAVSSAMAKTPLLFQTVASADGEPSSPLPTPAQTLDSLNLIWTQVLSLQELAKKK